jgi:DNA-binding MarR family transcriptional regulator
MCRGEACHHGRYLDVETLTDPAPARARQTGGVPDSVDALLAAWRRERPDVDSAPLEVFSRVSRLALHLGRSRALAFREVDLEEWGFDVLAALRRSGPPYQLSPGSLQAQTLVSSATTTHRLDRLEALGLIARARSPADGRGVQVSLTPEGRRRVDRALELLAAAEAALLAPLGVHDRSALADLLRRLLAAAEDG